jgi:holo-[acyl-carrier protein] synthase
MDIYTLKNMEELYGEIGACLDNFEICNISFVRENLTLLLGKLTENEKYLYDKYLREEAKYEFLGGRLLVKRCLLKEINKDKNRNLGFLDIDIRRDENGTPVLYVRDIKPDNLYFSISHKKNYIFCAVDPVRVIGVDVEKIGGKLEELKSYYMSSEEEGVILDYAAGKESPLLYYTALWASKECLVKCLKKNLWEVFRKVRLTGIEENRYLLKYVADDEVYNISSDNFMYDGYIFSIVSLS